MADSIDGLKAAQEALTEVQLALDQMGISLIYLAKKHKKELNAKETKIFKGKVLKLNPQTKEVVEVEEIIYSKPLISWDIRQKARQDAHRLRGDYPPEKKRFEADQDQLHELMEAVRQAPIEREKTEVGIDKK